MADSSAGKSDSLDSEGDFIDPLGAKDPLSQGLEEDFEEFNIELSPTQPKLRLDNLFGVQPNRTSELSNDDEFEDEAKDLFVIVDNPEKHTTAMESYITFRVTTKTTRSEFADQEYQVRRRYNDFLWLRQRLEENRPTLLVPEFAAAKKEGSGFISRMADSIHNMSTAYMMKNRPEEFTNIQEYIGQLCEKLGVLDRISQRVIREQQDHLAELNEWGPIFTLWSNSEDKMSPGLAGVAKSVEKCFLALQELVDSTDSGLNQPLKEYILYTEAVKAVLRRRDAIQSEYELTVDELNKKKEERDQAEDDPSLKVQVTDKAYTIGAIMGKSPDVVKQEKLEKVSLLVHELSQQVETLNDKMTCSNADLKADMERWHKTKRRDFRELFTDMADRQIQYYQKCLSAWEEAIPKIQKTDAQKDHSDTSSTPEKDNSLAD